MTLSARNTNLDLIRTLAIIGVLLIHLTYPLYSRPDFLGGVMWWVAQLLNVISRPSIPLFIMVSGYLLIDRQETLKQTVDRTWVRLGIPLVFWSVFYTLWLSYWLKTPLSLSATISNILSGGVGHLYFLVILIGLYLLLPIVRTFWFNASEQLKKYLTFGSLGFGILYTLLTYVPFKGITTTVLTIGLPYLGYFLFGHYVKEKIFTRTTLQKLGVIWFISLLMTIVLGYLNLQAFAQNQLLFWKTISYFDDYLSINIAILSLTSFILLLHVPSKVIENNLCKKVLSLFVPTSFGLYLLHPWVMNIIDTVFDLQVDYGGDSLVMYLLKRTLLVTFFTIALVLLVIRIPYFNSILGEKTPRLKNK